MASSAAATTIQVSTSDDKTPSYDRWDKTIGDSKSAFSTADEAKAATLHLLQHMERVESEWIQASRMSDNPRTKARNVLPVIQLAIDKSDIFSKYGFMPGPCGQSLGFEAFNKAAKPPAQGGFGLNGIKELMDVLSSAMMIGSAVDEGYCAEMKTKFMAE